MACGVLPQFGRQRAEGGIPFRPQTETCACFILAWDCEISALGIGGKSVILTLGQHRFPSWKGNRSFHCIGFPRDILGLAPEPLAELPSLDVRIALLGPLVGLQLGPVRRISGRLV